MLRLHALFFGLLALPALAAAPVEPLPNPIQVPGAPWYFDSFIVDTPREEGWASFSKDAKSAEMGKKYDDGRTASAIVEAYKLQAPVASQEALLQIAKQTSGAGAEPGKVTDYSSEVIAPKGLLCARSLARLEDRREQSEQAATLVVRGLTCVRPDRPEIVVGLRFAQRTPAGSPAAPADDGRGCVERDDDGRLGTRRQLQRRESALHLDLRDRVPQGDEGSPAAGRCGRGSACRSKG